VFSEYFLLNCGSYLVIAYSKWRLLTIHLGILHHSKWRVHSINSISFLIFLLSFYSLCLLSFPFAYLLFIFYLVIILLPSILYYFNYPIHHLHHIIVFSFFLSRREPSHLLNHSVKFVSNNNLL